MSTDETPESMRRISESAIKTLYKLQMLVGMTEKEFRMFCLVSALLVSGACIRYGRVYVATTGNPEFVKFDAEFRRLTARADSIAEAKEKAERALIAAMPEFQPQPETGLDLNTALAEDLIALPRIGPSLASAIIEVREQLGGFLIVDDLLLVSGIGAKTLDKLRPLIRVDRSVTSTQAPVSPSTESIRNSLPLPQTAH